MLKLQTPVTEDKCRAGISYSDKIMVLGSCFADNAGRILSDFGFDVLVNPFGTLYNPASVASAVERLVSGQGFTEEECVKIGSGDGRTCSFSHHTSFARESAAAFLENANASLREASAFYRSCSKVIITLGTAWCFRYTGPACADAPAGACSPALSAGARTDDFPAASLRGKIVSNCLKRNASEFTRERLSVREVAELLEKTVAAQASAGKHFIFTVSPIRHLADGAHGNQLSKSTLLLAIEQVAAQFGNTDYFPAFEIMNDELRDYRFYAEDMVHPSMQAAAYIADRFLIWALPPEERPLLEKNMKLHKAASHIQK